MGHVSGNWIRMDMGFKFIKFSNGCDMDMEIKHWKQRAILFY